MNNQINVAAKAGESVHVTVDESDLVKELRAENEQLRFRYQRLVEDYEALRQQRLHHPRQPMKIVGRDDHGTDWVLQILDIDQYNAIVQLPKAPLSPKAVGSFSLFRGDDGRTQLRFPEGLLYGTYNLTK